MITQPESPATAASAPKSAMPTPTEAPSPAQPIPTVTVTATTSETVQVVPSSLKIDDADGMDVADWTAIVMAVAAVVSLTATLNLLSLTRKALTENKTMAAQAVKSSTASQMAAESAQESASVTAATVQIDLIADMKVETKGRPVKTGQTPEMHALIDKMKELNQMSGEYDCAVEEHAQLDRDQRSEFNKKFKEWMATPGPGTLKGTLYSEGPTVTVHRVVFLEFSNTAHDEGDEFNPAPLTNGESYLDGPLLFRKENDPSKVAKPLSPEGIIDLKDQDGRTFPLLLQSGDRILLEAKLPTKVAPFMARTYIARNRIMVEYSFEGGVTTRWSRARWNEDFIEGEYVQPYGGIVPQLSSRRNPLISESNPALDKPASRFADRTSFRAWLVDRLRAIVDHLDK